MGRKNVLNHQIITSQTLGASFDTFATPRSVQYLDNIGAIIKWTTGGTPVGTFQVYVSNKETAPSVLADYTALDFGTTITIDNSNTEHLLTMTGLPYSWIAFKYTRTSGTGSLDMFMTAKESG